MKVHKVCKVRKVILINNKTTSFPKHIINMYGVRWFCFLSRAAHGVVAVSPFSSLSIESIDSTKLSPPTVREKKNDYDADATNNIYHNNLLCQVSCFKFIPIFFFGQ